MERYGETDVQEGNESVKASDSGLTPPNTVLVRWMDELLLLDAWNIRGNKLRSMPSLVDEAMTHFRLSGTAKNYRLAVHELVDGHPALLYLGLSALRFIENGRVLDLVEVPEVDTALSTPRVSGWPEDQESITDTWETAPLAEETTHHYSDLSTTSSSEEDSADGYRSASTLSEAASRNSSFLHLRVKGRPGRQGSTLSHTEPPSRKSSRVAHLSKTQSQAILHPKDGDRVDTGASPCVYVHPKYGAIFKHLGNQGPHEQESDDVAAQDEFPGRKPFEKHSDGDDRDMEAGITYDFRSHRILPRPVLSRPSSPLPDLHKDPQGEPRSRAISRTPSHTSDMSRRAAQAARRQYADNDPWLGSENAEKWRNVRLDKRDVSNAQRSRSFDRIMTGHPETAANAAFIRDRLPRTQSYTAFAQARSNERKKQFSRS